MSKELTRQLNPFGIKAEVALLISQFKNINDIAKYIDIIKLLDEQLDKKTIVKILFKELYNLKTDDGSILCFLLERYSEKEELTKRLWELLKNNMIPNNVKIIVVNFLRGLDSNWTLDSGDELLDNEILDAETSKLLDNAIINPEVQIDFLDFLTSLSNNDKITLINSLSKDYSKDALANILIPVFLSQPDSEVGLEALKLLGESKSPLAFHALNSSIDLVKENIRPLVKKSISTLKIAGIREDNSLEFYKNILAESKPYRFCVTYPDGHGNQALIFTRKTSENKVRFVAIVIDDTHGIRDCFGFFEISQFECDKIIERFYKGEDELEVTPKTLKTILINAEKTSHKNVDNWLLPYEYVCWRNLLCDIDYEDIEDIEFKQCTNPLTKFDLEKVFKMDFIDKWFLNPNYSDEFEKMLLSKPENFDKMIEDNLLKVFYEEEKNVWYARILAAAYLKRETGDIESSEILYGLYNNEQLKTEFLKNILRRSVYEYYINLKFSTELNNGRYTLSELDSIIKEIEGLWVCTK